MDVSEPAVSHPGHPAGPVQQEQRDPAEQGRHGQRHPEHAQLERTESAGGQQGLGAVLAGTGPVLGMAPVLCLARFSRFTAKDSACHGPIGDSCAPPTLTSAVVLF